MTQTSQMSERKDRLVKALIFFLALFVLFLALNFRQLYSAWAVRSETNRLTALAESAPDEYNDPVHLEDRFEEKLSGDFWKFTTINGAGVVSNELAWRARTATHRRSRKGGVSARPRSVHTSVLSPTRSSNRRNVPNP